MMTMIDVRTEDLRKGDRIVSTPFEDLSFDGSYIDGIEARYLEVNPPLAIAVIEVRFDGGFALQCLADEVWQVLR